MLEGIQLALQGVPQFGSIPSANSLTADQLFYPDLINAALAD